ncbi:MAG: GHMP kinase [Phycisphaeraceae bacterium]|nr:GHMP kinase [Phycisphaeraceae bacterium]
MNIFVPGRICLFGEHSDWAGGYRRVNGELEKGYTIIAATNQGVYATVKPHPSRLRITADSEGTRMGPFEVPMERDALLEAAEQGGFFSYAAGVAYQILTNYRVGGLEIDNHRTDLPVKKGLSSSAAVCVLVARAFNRVYDLKMTTRGEMEAAYMGEITTPSRCGRMDQGCAYGRPIMMVFDGDRIDVTEFSVPRDLHFVIVDLNAAKDTRVILNQLNNCYPFPDDDLQTNVQKYLGPISAGTTREAYQALYEGDAERIGSLMTEAQSAFDRHLQPACPSQLTAPVLHKILDYAPIRSHVLGGKGVGSQGDGTAQFIVRDEASQERVIEILSRDLGLSCLKLTIQATRPVRKAVIPVAGFGTRLFPASKAIKKELFPIIDRDGRAKPVVQAIVEEALSAGIDEICLIVQPEDRATFEAFFTQRPEIENFNKLSKENQAYCEYLMEIGARITFVEQATQEGFGHAVHCARDWVGDEPFLLVLGDHLYASSNDTTCAQQLLDVYRDAGHSVVGLQRTHVSIVHQVGCVTGTWEEPDSVLTVTEFCEKPNAETARQRLRVDGLPDDQFLTVSGMYVLTPQIFDLLADHIERDIRERGEFQLTSCLDRLRREDAFTGYVVQGGRFDIGLPDLYRQAVFDFRNA